MLIEQSHVRCMRTKTESIESDHLLEIVVRSGEETVMIQWIDHPTSIFVVEIELGMDEC